MGPATGPELAAVVISFGPSEEFPEGFEGTGTMLDWGVLAGVVKEVTAVVVSEGLLRF